jgi:hypothetical protein
MPLPAQRISFQRRAAICNHKAVQADHAEIRWSLVELCEASESSFGLNPWQPSGEHETHFPPTATDVKQSACIPRF